MVTQNIQYKAATYAGNVLNGTTTITKRIAQGFHYFKYPIIRNKWTYMLCIQWLYLAKLQPACVHLKYTKKEMNEMTRLMIFISLVPHDLGLSTTSLTNLVFLTPTILYNLFDNSNCMFQSLQESKLCLSYHGCKEKSVFFFFLLNEPQQVRT